MGCYSIKVTYKSFDKKIERRSAIDNLLSRLESARIQFLSSERKMVIDVDKE